LDNSKISNIFYEKYGFLNSSKKLAFIMNKTCGTNYDAVAYKEWKKPLNKIIKKIK